jgi:CheY-like chemotaxis protein
VLLVDDDEDVRFLMTRMLRKAGVEQVKAVAGGEAALASLRSGDVPSLVILDQNMPGMNGVQVVAEIRALFPVLPILISSGQPDIEDWSSFRQPWVGVIAKPFDVTEIAAKLAHFQQERT